jgi:hypothetical protein
MAQRYSQKQTAARAALFGLYGYLPARRHSALAKILTVNALRHLTYPPITLCGDRKTQLTHGFTPVWYQAP